MADASTIDIPLHGMTCASCVRRVERALGRISGVDDVQVNLASERARITGRALTLSAVLQAVENAGYDVPLQRQVLDIEGMSCASCAGRIERAVAGVPGVIRVEVNLASEQARVEQTAGSDPQAVVAAIARAGYGARFHQAHSTEVQSGSGKLPDSAALWLAAVLTVPLLLPMLAVPFGHEPMLPAWLQFLLATPVQFWLGARFYRAAWHALRAKAGNMDLLVALGTSAAYGLSLYQWWLSSPGHSPHLYFEASATVITLVMLGKYLERRAKREAGSAMRALASLRPATARRVEADSEIDVPLADLRVGDTVAVLPGARVPADGEILSGVSQNDESLLTGESRPVDKGPGDPVTGGAINGDGRLLVQVRAVGSETALSRIIRLVEDAQAAKAPIQKLVDRVSAVFVPGVMLLALLTLIGWLSIGATAETAIVNAVAVLVIACPCALGLATPAAIIAGTGAAARQGILIRDAQTLEIAHRVSDVAFDKTGTLTQATPRIAHLRALDGDDASLLRLAGALQRGSEHLLARAVLAACEMRAIEPPHVENSRGLPGIGISGRVAKRNLVLGNRQVLPAEVPASLSSLAARWEQEGCTLSWLVEQAPQPRVLGLVAFGDPVREGAATAIRRLRQQGIRCHLLTGDNRGSAERVAATLGLDHVHPERLPGDKADAISALKRQGKTVAMVGDGVNDAPALAAADVGIAMGGGTDVARQAAGIILMSDDPTRIPAALDISRRTYAKIRQNLFWAFAYNVVGLPLAALGLLNPMVAGAAMALSSVSVISNALLLRRWRAEE